MAKLPNQTISTIFRLQQRLVALLDTATAAEYSLLQQFGETQETMPELEAIDNVKERLRIPYNRLHRILQQVAESQPAATADVLDFLYRTIDQGEQSPMPQKPVCKKLKGVGTCHDSTAKNTRFRDKTAKCC